MPYQFSITLVTSHHIKAEPIRRKKVARAGKRLRDSHIPFVRTHEYTMSNENSEKDIGVQREGQNNKIASHWLLPLSLSEMAILP